MPIADTPGMKRTFGPLNRSATVCLSEVSIDFKLATYTFIGEATLESAIISYVNRTSSAVHGVPSWNCTPGVSLNVTASASSDAVQPRAIPGTRSPFSLKSVSPL